MNSGIDGCGAGAGCNIERVCAGRKRVGKRLCLIGFPFAGHMAARAPRRSARLLHSEPTVVGPAGDAPASFHFTPAAGTAQPGSPVTRFNVVLGQLVCRGVDWKWVRAPVQVERTHRGAPSALRGTRRAQRAGVLLVSSLLPLLQGLLTRIPYARAGQPGRWCGHCRYSHRAARKQRD